MENDKVKTESPRALERNGNAEERARLIKQLEREWVEKEKEVSEAVEKAAKPHGLFGWLGLSTSTG